MKNLTGELFELSARADLISSVFTIAMAGLTVVVWGPRTLTRQEIELRETGVQP